MNTDRHRFKRATDYTDYTYNKATDYTDYTDKKFLAKNAKGKRNLTVYIFFNVMKF